MNYTQIAIYGMAAALVIFGIWAIRKAAKLCRKVPEVPLTAPDVVTDDIVESCGCVYCDMDLLPQMTSFGFYHMQDFKDGMPHLIRCTRDWSHSCQ